MDITIVLPLAAGHENKLVIVLFQLCVIIGVARLFSVLFKKIGQPGVVGEIAAGLILGPSVFGKIEVLLGYTNHELSHAVFNPVVGDVFGILKELGLILLLFLVGMEFEFSHLRKARKSALSISIAGVVLPFVMGFGLAHLIHPYIEQVAGADNVLHAVDVNGFALFMGTAMSITALPILGRMMMEFGVSRTRTAAITITAAAADDATGWMLLAAVSAMVQSKYDLGLTLRMIGMTVGFALFMFFVLRPILIRGIRAVMKNGATEIGLTGHAVLLIVIFLCAIATSYIGIFAIFGAFLLGAVLSDQHEFRAAVTRETRSFVTVFFLPIFFTYTGLRTDIGSLSSPMLWMIAGLVCVVAIVGKFGGCALAARFSGFNRAESLCIGIMMNTRALMELIVVNVGYELGIIPKSVFCMLVIMAVLTTFMTTPLLRRFKQGTDLDVVF